jgi:hypothetical protein
MNASDEASEASAVGPNGQAQADADQQFQEQAPANASPPPNHPEPDANHQHIYPVQAEPNHCVGLYRLYVGRPFN